MAVTRLRDYGARGLLGVLTPQANTTVEAEFWALLPPAWSLINARLTSARDTIEQRLLHYTTKFDDAVGEFANAPVEAVAIACTGASYLIGADEEARITAALRARLGVPVVTAAQAASAMLNALGARRIALLTPYPAALNRASARYWASRGFEVVTAQGPAPEQGAFHPIYALSAEDVYRAYRRLSSADAGADAVLMLGTGMATLAPLLRGRERGLLPALSCNLALVWDAVRQADPASADAYPLQDWLAGAHWSERLALLFPSGR